MPMNVINQALERSWLEGRHNLVIIMILGALIWGLVYAPLVSVFVLLGGITLAVGLIRPRLLIYIGLFFTLIEVTQLIFYFDYSLVSYDYIVILPIASFFFLLACLYWGGGRLAGLYPAPSYVNTLDLPVIVVLLSGLISVVWTPYPFDGINLQIKGFLSLVMYFAIVRFIQTTGQVESIVKFWVFAGIFIVVTFMLTFFISFTINVSWFWEIFGGRLTLREITIAQYEGTIATTGGFSGGSKLISPSLTIAIPLTVAFLCNQKRVLMRRFLQVAILLMLTLQILTMSRTDLAGLGLGWLVFVGIMPNWRPHFIRYQLFMAAFVALAMTICISLLLTFYPHNFGEFNQRYLLGEKYQTRGGISSESLGTGSVEVRYSRILWTIEQIWNTGGLGAGSGGILRQEDPTHKRDVGTAFMSIFWEHGFGLLSYIVFAWASANIWFEMRKSLKRCTNERHLNYLRGFCWVLFAFGIMSMLDYHYVFPRFWQVLGFGMAAAQAVYQKAEGVC